MLSSFEGIYNFLYNFLLDISKEMFIMIKKSGNDGREVTPVPIPNTEVKLSSADGSWDLVPVRIGRCQANIIPQ